MSEYWAGVLIGISLSALFFIVALLCLQSRIDGIRADFEELRAEHDQIQEWIYDNETVMKTYEFFNTHIKELLEEKKNDSTD